MQVSAYFALAQTSLDLGQYPEAETAVREAGKLLLLADSGGKEPL